MPSYFDANQGYFVREPSWHQLEQKILADWPGSWSEARQQAELLWEPIAKPVFARTGTRLGAYDVEEGVYTPIEGYQRILRSDTGGTLTVQTTAYEIISNTDFGAVIENLLGEMPGEIHYEGVFTLHGGRLVIALVRFDAPISVKGDPSKTVQYAAFCARHDGQGGLKVVLTNVRVVCANTWGMAEHTSETDKTSFVIKHSKNWADRVEEVKAKLLIAADANMAYIAISELLMLKKVTPRNRETFLRRLLPVGDDMGPRQKTNREGEREAIRIILQGRTCEGIDKTAYGLMQAAGEWADHYRKFRSVDTYVNRSLFTKEPIKERAFREAKRLAGIK